MIYKNFDITYVFCTFFFFFTLFFFKIIVSMQVKYTFLYKYSQKPPLDLYYHQTLLIIHLIYHSSNLFKIPSSFSLTQLS